MKKFVSLRLSQKSVLAKIELGKTNVAKMTGNIYFPAPYPTLATLQNVVTICENASSLAMNGSKQQKAELDEAEAILDATLTQLGNYVDSIADGNETIILSAGFDTQSERVPAEVPDAPFLRSVANNNIPLSLRVKWDAVKFAKTYVVEMNDDESLPIANWKQVAIQTQTVVFIDNLVSGKIYAFRIKAVGVKGIGMYSNVVYCRVL
jgi:hypothetical protein